MPQREEMPKSCASRMHPRHAANLENTVSSRSRLAVGSSSWLDSQGGSPVGSPTSIRSAGVHSSTPNEVPDVSPAHHDLLSRYNPDVIAELVNDAFYQLYGTCLCSSAPKSLSSSCRTAPRGLSPLTRVPICETEPTILLEATSWLKDLKIPFAVVAGTEAAPQRVELVFSKSFVGLATVREQSDGMRRTRGRAIHEMTPDQVNQLLMAAAADGSTCHDALTKYLS